MAPKLGIDNQFCTSTGDFKSVWKTEQFDLFFEHCRSSGNEKASWYMKNCLSYTRSSWFYPYNISRRGITSICRMRCGHTSLNESLFRFSIVASPNCSVCDTPETLDHVLWECTRFNSQRTQLINHLISSISTLSLPAKSLLVCLKDENIVLALDHFVNTIGYNI